MLDRHRRVPLTLARALACFFAGFLAANCGDSVGEGSTDGASTTVGSGESADGHVAGHHAHRPGGNERGAANNPQQT